MNWKYKEKQKHGPCTQKTYSLKGIEHANNYTTTKQAQNKLREGTRNARNNLLQKVGFKLSLTKVEGRKKNIPGMRNNSEKVLNQEMECECVRKSWSVILLYVNGIKFKKAEKEEEVRV